MANFSNRKLSHQMRLVEARFGVPVEELLRRLRLDGHGASAIARLIDVPCGTAYRWLVEFELDDSSLIRRALGRECGIPEEAGKGGMAREAG